MGKRNDKVLNELRRGPLTPLECLNKLGIMRLAAAVFDLKEQGHQIRTEMVDVTCREGRVARVAKYHLMLSGPPSTPPDGPPEAQGATTARLDVRARVLEALTKLGPSGATAGELRLLTGAKEQQVASALFALRDANVVGPGVADVPVAGSKYKARPWYLTEHIPRPTHGDRTQRRHHSTKTCPRCHEHSFRDIEGGGSECNRCGLIQGGLFGDGSK
jgi:hypothetical protein